MPAFAGEGLAYGAISPSSVYLIRKIRPRHLPRWLRCCLGTICPTMRARVQVLALLSIPSFCSCASGRQQGPLQESVSLGLLLTWKTRTDFQVPGLVQLRQASGEWPSRWKVSLCAFQQISLIKKINPSIFIVKYSYIWNSTIYFLCIILSFT